MAGILLKELAAGVVCLTEGDLVALGEVFGGLLCDGDIVALRGDLGVGKTTFAKGIARALGVVEPVTSPTFSIMAQYSGAMNLIHIDAYRLDGREYLGVLEYIHGPYVVVVEWVENLPELRESVTRSVRIVAKSGGERRVYLM
ncbi:MAG: tRNA (adenosine(37)-N6)-threonylcarbamoyltransferase complex ATPase subunit type 1 TsaE [Puniceicoccales bacterium]|jgi:tRNA threonylcarbamoyladenosine biosynthesis protein TsaE|nr:tRNA (adenosine(37)-N6)-threonylcarbamoyltransferase complex ATPase subunit type 1 TsaE [Puniceicoccales bacterium]